MLVLSPLQPAVTRGDNVTLSCLVQSPSALRFAALLDDYLLRKLLLFYTHSHYILFAILYFSLFIVYFSWLFDDGPLLPNSFVDTISTTVSHLTLVSVEDSNTGSYTCTASALNSSAVNDDTAYVEVVGMIPKSWECFQFQWVFMFQIFN